MNHVCFHNKSVGNTKPALRMSGTTMGGQSVGGQSGYFAGEDLSGVFRSSIHCAGKMFVPATVTGGGGVLVAIFIHKAYVIKSL